MPASNRICIESFASSKHPANWPCYALNVYGIIHAMTLLLSHEQVRVQDSAVQRPPSCAQWQDLERDPASPSRSIDGIAVGSWARYSVWSAYANIHKSF